MKKKAGLEPYSSPFSPVFAKALRPRPEPLVSLEPWPGGKPPEKIPRHVAIIMDGNGRWAKRNRLKREKGHEAGGESVRDALEFCRGTGIEYLTLYAFSAENWNRSRYEVDYLWRLMARFIKSERDELKRQGVRLRVIGDPARIPAKTRKILIETIGMLAGGNVLELCVALNYGGRQEIARAARNIAAAAAAGEISPDDVGVKTVDAQLWAPSMPDPDLLIRTAGEMRVSNFLLWEIAYTEFWSTPVLWPDFRSEHFREALAAYDSRRRTYGGRPKKKKSFE